MTRLVERLADISGAYDALFCDLWGCVHDGLRALDPACEALRRYRAEGGEVVMLTNSPRPWTGVAPQIADLGVPDDCWDAIVTSGDSSRLALFEGAVGRRVYHIGLQVETAFFEPPEEARRPLEIERVALDSAEGIVCTGPADATADPSAHRAELLYAKANGLKLLCANPDVVVDRGEVREWCAGAIAQLYTEMGGESLYFGKPHPPIYDLARRKLTRPVEPDRILAIGDGIATDIAGAMGEGLDSLFVTGGLAAAETRTERQPDPDALEAYVARASVSPTYAVGQLR